MHGRKRLTKPLSAEEVAGQRAKAEKYRKLMSHVLAARKRGDRSRETLGIVSKLLVVNADAYTLWNYRREFELEAKEELQLTAQCLEKNPKSYAAWYHRRWILARHPELAAAELELCAQFLEADERNFHCWNHRRFASTLAKEADDDVVRFALEKLDANFSNYSAFHQLAQRGAHVVQDDDDDDDDAAATKNLDLVAQAVFTEPDDQSAWWYQECLARRLVTKSSRDDDKREKNEALLRHQIDALGQLRDLEPASKWPAVALFRLHKLLGDRDELPALHDALLNLDPLHATMYSSSRDKRS